MCAVVLSSTIFTTFAVNFYENVKEYFKKDVDICPYCLRKISEQYRNELVKDIENILNDEINQYKTKQAYT